MKRITKDKNGKVLLIEKLDERGNKIYEKDSDGIEKWWEYDDKGNIIHYKDSYGNEEFYEYKD